MPDTPYTTTYDPAAHDGATVAWRDPDGNWHTATTPNRYLLPDAGNQIVVLEEAPEPDWPTEDAILIRRGYDSSRGHVYNIVAYRTGNGTYVGRLNGRTSPTFSFYPNLDGDHIYAYEPLAVVPANALDTFLRDYGEGSHRCTDADRFRTALREFQSRTNDQ